MNCFGKIVLHAGTGFAGNDNGGFFRFFLKEEFINLQKK